MAAGPSARKTSKQRKSSADYIAERVALAKQFEEFEEDLAPEDRAAIIALHDGYSEGNALRIAMQDPEATDVRGYRAWQQVGRQVRKGETGIRILAPASSKAPREAIEEARKNGEQTTAKMRMKLTSVFDIRQTDEMTAEQLAEYARQQLARAGAA